MASWFPAYQDCQSIRGFLASEFTLPGVISFPRLPNRAQASPSFPMASEFKLELLQRPRRVRRTASLRAMVEETVLRPADFIAPLFVVEGRQPPEEIKSMPGI